VSPVPNLGKTTRSPQSDLTPWILTLILDHESIFFQEWIKLRFPEKLKKFKEISFLVLTLTMSKLVGRFFFQILWTSQNIWTLRWFWIGIFIYIHHSNDFFLGKDTCRGDSGGPLVLKLGPYKTYYQMGIVSFGFEGVCGNGRPAIYTRLTSYLEWIQASLEPWLMQMVTSLIFCLLKWFLSTYATVGTTFFHSKTIILKIWCTGTPEFCHTGQTLIFQTDKLATT